MRQPIRTHKSLRKIRAKTPNSGTFLVFSAAICWGLSGGIAGLLIEEGWGPFLISFYRAAIGLIAFSSWLILAPAKSGLHKKKLWLWSLLAGLGVAGNFSFYFLSISESGVSIAATLMYCAPIFVYLLSFLLKLEKPTFLKFIGIGFVVVGVALLTEVYKADGSTMNVLGLLFGLLAGASLALFIFSFKYATRHGSPQSILSISFLVVLITLFVPSQPSNIIAASVSEQLPLLILLGVLGGGTSFILYLFGLRKTAPAIASVVALAEPISASLFGVVVLGEKLAIAQLIGIVIILVTVTLLSVASSRR